MRQLWHNVQRLAGWKKLVLGLMLLVIVLTWLAVCLILGSYLIS